jgi:hypothetical protein
MRHSYLGALIPLLAVVPAVHAQTIAEKHERAKVEEKLAAATADVCGRHVASRFDWRAYDALDWAKAGKDKREWLGFERSTLDSMHDGIAKVCSDADYKAALAKIDTIVYVPTDDDRRRLDATIVGSTLTFTNFTFGSTRDIDDFEKAIREVKMPGDAAPAKAPEPAKPAGPVKPSAPVKLGTPSAKFDATYTSTGGAIGQGCFDIEYVHKITVKGGKISFRWLIGDPDFRGGGDAKPVDLGHADGVVHADGSATLVGTFDGPYLHSPQVKIVKLKRMVDAIGAIAMHFEKTDSGKRASLHIVIPVEGSRGDNRCEADWQWDDPKIIAAEEARERAIERAKTPAQRARERKEAEAKKAADDRDSKERDERYTRQHRCYEGCEPKEDTCKSRCFSAQSSCNSGCDQNNDCSQRCSSSLMTCESNCSQDRSTCESDCNNL